MKFNYTNMRVLLVALALSQVAVTGVEAAARLAQLRRAAKAARSENAQAVMLAGQQKEAALAAIIAKASNIEGSRVGPRLVALREKRKASTGNSSLAAEEQNQLHLLLNSKHVTSADRVNAAVHGLVKNTAMLHLTPAESAAVEKSHKTAIKRNIFSEEKLTNVFGSKSASIYKKDALAKAAAKVKTLQAATALKEAEAAARSARSTYGRGSPEHFAASEKYSNAKAKLEKQSAKYQAKKTELADMRARILNPSILSGEATTSEQREAHAAMRRQADILK